MKNNELLKIAQTAFYTHKESVCTYKAATAQYLAWHVGAWMEKTGRTPPRHISKKSGKTIEINDMLIDISNIQRIVRLN